MFCSGLVFTALWMAALAHGADDVRLQRSATLAGPRADAAMRLLLPLLRAVSQREPMAQLQAVNEFFNRRIAFVGDQQVWGVVDYWASPVELMNKGQGDCEDYAIAKYFSLLAMGMPAGRLRLVYVRAQLDDGQAQAHMVLAYYPGSGADTLILDNLVEEVLPAQQRRDLHPVFSFNSDGLWQGVGSIGMGDPAARLSRWREVMAKARAEGFL